MACVALVAAGGGYFVAMQLGTPHGVTRVPAPPVPPQSEELLGQKRPDFSLTDLDGASVTASDFDGGIWLLNGYLLVWLENPHRLSTAAWLPGIFTDLSAPDDRPGLPV